MFQEIWLPSLVLLKFQAQKNVSKTFVFLLLKVTGKLYAA